MDSKVRIAVIGLGYLGKYHAQKLKGIDNCNLIAVCDLDFTIANEVANELGDCQPFNDFSLLIGKVDAVSIVTPTVSHFDIARFFISHGVHVFIEKPMTHTVEQAKELVDLGKLNNVFIQVGFIEQFNPIFLKEKPFISNPLFIESTRIAPFSRRSMDVDVVLDLMIHDINLVHTLVGTDIVSVHACSAPVVTANMDIASVRLEFSSGCTVNFTSSRVSTKTERRIRVFAKNNYVNIDFHKKECSVMSLPESFNATDAEFLPSLINNHFSSDLSDPLLSELSSFVDCVSNSEPPKVDGQSGLTSLNTAYLIKREIDSYISNNKFLLQ